VLTRRGLQGLSPLGILDMVGWTLPLPDF
jgi:hypothetical protein